MDFFYTVESKMMQQKLVGEVGGVYDLLTWLLMPVLKGAKGAKKKIC
jgi:hypothetical protein